MPATTAASAADILAWADLHRVESHCTAMLLEKGDRRKTLPINLRPEPRIMRDTLVAALMEADGGRFGTDPWSSPYRTPWLTETGERTR